MQHQRVLGVTALTAAAALAAASPSAAEPYRPLTLTSVPVIGTDNTELYAHAAYGFGRENKQGAEYDSLHLGPLGFRYGLTEAFEYGAYFSFMNNIDDDPGAPEESGLEGITGFAKLQLSRHLALEAGLRAGGADDIAPYPNDGLDLYLNLPMQHEIGEGLAYGELGYTIQDEVDGALGGNYLSWGVGYAHPLEDGTKLNVELRGDEAPVKPDRNHLELLLGAGLQVEQIHLRPYVGLGIHDPSPDLSLGVSASLAL
ncbi:MAG: hypothetical protein ACLFMS_01235 [Halorhodospira sp.]